MKVAGWCKELNVKRENRMMHNLKDELDGGTKPEDTLEVIRVSVLSAINLIFTLVFHFDAKCETVKGRMFGKKKKKKIPRATTTITTKSVCAITTNST